MIWVAIASELDPTAWKIDKVFKQRFDANRFLVLRKE
jgi:hypothetical protein